MTQKTEQDQKPDIDKGQKADAAPEPVKAKSDLDIANSKIAALRDGDGLDPKTIASELQSLMTSAKTIALEEARKEFEQQLAPLRRQHAVADLRANLGLSPKQAEAVLEVQGKYSQMPAEQALLIARSANEALWPNQPPRVPVGGDSFYREPTRSDPAELARRMYGEDVADRQKASIEWIARAMGMGPGANQ